MDEGHYKLTKDKFNKLWHLKRDVLTFQRVICLARNRTFREEDYSPLLNLFLKWQKKKQENNLRKKQFNN